MFMQVAGEHEPSSPILVPQFPFYPALFVLYILCVDAFIFRIHKLPFMYYNIVVVDPTIHVF